MLQTIRGFRPLREKGEDSQGQFKFVSRLTLRPSYSQEALEHSVEVRRFGWRVPSADATPKKQEAPPSTNENTKE